MDAICQILEKDKFFWRKLDGFHDTFNLIVKKDDLLYELLVPM
jgi:hypothetical protein